MLHVIKVLVKWDESVLCIAATQIYLDKKKHAAIRQSFLLTLLQAIIDWRIWCSNSSNIWVNLDWWAVLLSIFLMDHGIFQWTYFQVSEE